MRSCLRLAEWHTFLKISLNSTTQQMMVFVRLPTSSRTLGPFNIFAPSLSACSVSMWVGNVRSVLEQRGRAHALVPRVTSPSLRILFMTLRLQRCYCWRGVYDVTRLQVHAVDEVVSVVREGLAAPQPTPRRAHAAAQHAAHAHRHHHACNDFIYLSICT